MSSWLATSDTCILVLVRGRLAARLRRYQGICPQLQRAWHDTTWAASGLRRESLSPAPSPSPGRLPASPIKPWHTPHQIRYPLVESPRLGPDGGDSPLHLPSHPLAPPPHPVPWYCYTGRNPTHPSALPGNRQQATGLSRPRAAFESSRPNLGDRVPCAAPPPCGIGTRQILLLFCVCSPTGAADHDIHRDYGPCARMR